MVNIQHNIMILLYCSAAYFGLTVYAWKKGFTQLFTVSRPADVIGYINTKHVLGMVLLAVIPCILLRKDYAAFLFSVQHHSSIQITCLFIFSILIHISAKKSSGKMELNWNHSASTPLSSMVIRTYLFGRSIFIVAYEIFFRGFLLFGLASVYGIQVAFAINILFYFLVHCFNGKTEMIASVPFGCLLCGMSWWMVSVWPAVIMHLVLSLSYEINGFTIYSIHHKKSAL